METLGGGISCPFITCISYYCSAESCCRTPQLTPREFVAWGERLHVRRKDQLWVTPRLEVRRSTFYVLWRISISCFFSIISLQFQRIKLWDLVFVRLLMLVGAIAGKKCDVRWSFFHTKVFYSSFFLFFFWDRNERLKNRSNDDDCLVYTLSRYILDYSWPQSYHNESFSLSKFNDQAQFVWSSLGLWPSDIIERCIIASRINEHGILWGLGILQTSLHAGAQ